MYNLYITGNGIDCCYRKFLNKNIHLNMPEVRRYFPEYECYIEPNNINMSLCNWKINVNDTIRWLRGLTVYEYRVTRVGVNIIFLKYVKHYNYTSDYRFFRRPSLSTINATKRAKERIKNGR